MIHWFEQSINNRVKTIRQSYTIHASIGKVWQALVDPTQIEGWGGGPAIMNDKVGTTFKLWGGEIYGKNIEVVSHKKLVQEWFGGKWDEPSILTVHLYKKDPSTSSGQVTVVDLLHEKVPDEEAKDIEQGWKDYYMNPLKEFVES